MGMSWERMLALKEEYEKAERVDVKSEGFEGKKKPDLVIKNDGNFTIKEHFTVPSLSSQDYPTRIDSITYSYVIGNTVYDNPDEPILFLFYNGSLFVKIFGQGYPFQQMAIPVLQNGILFAYEEKDANGKYKYYPALYDGKDKIYLLQKEGMQLVYYLYPSSYQALVENTFTINLEATPNSMCLYNGELYYTIKGTREYSYPSGYVYTDYLLYKYNFETGTSTLVLNFVQDLGGVFGRENMIYYGRGLYLLVCNGELYCYGAYSDSNTLKNNLFLAKLNLNNKEYSLIANVPLGDTFSSNSYSYFFPDQFESTSHFNPLFAYDQKIYGKNFCYDTVTGQTSTEEQFYVRSSYKTNEDKTIEELTRANISVTETDTELQIKMQEKDLETGDITSKDIANLKKPTYKDFSPAIALKTFFPIVLKEEEQELNPNYSGNSGESPYITKTKDRLYIVRENRIFKVLRGKMIEMNQAPGPYLIPYRNKIHCFVSSGDGNALTLYGHEPEGVAGHYVLNSTSGKWEVIGNLPIITYGAYSATGAVTVGNYGTGIAVYKDEIHILSGTSYGYSGTNGRHWIYNDETGWRKGADTDVDLNNARMRSPYLFVYQDKLYGMNGEGNGSPNSSAITFVYDDENNKFVKIDRDPFSTKFDSSGYSSYYDNILSYYYGNSYGNYPSRFFEYKEKLYLMNDGILYLVKDFPEKKLEETLLIPICNFYETMVETSDRKDPITVSANYSMSTNKYDFDNMFKGRVPFVYQDKVCVLITDEDDFYICQVKIDETDEDISQSSLVIE